MAAIDDVRRALPGLSGPELREIVGKAQALLETAPGGGKSAPPLREDWLLQGIAHELESRGQLRAGGADVLPRTRGFTIYQKKIGDTRAVLTSWMGNIDAKWPPPKRVLLGRVFARALANYIQRWTVVSVTTMLVNIDTLPEAVESAFPGYIASGLLSYVVGDRVHHHHS